MSATDTLLGRRSNVVPISGKDAKPSDQPPDAPDTRPTVLLKPGLLHEARDQIEQPLIEEGAIYVRNGQLVRVVSLEGPRTHHGINRPTGAAQIIPWEAPDLSAKISEVVAIEKVRGSGDHQRIAAADCPRHIVEAILANAESPAPELRSLVSTPFVDQKGRLYDRPGYIAEHGLFLTGVPDGWQTFFRPKLQPSRKDAEAALDILREALSTWPFAKDTDESAAIAALLTGIERAILPSAPAVGIDATSPGSGKTLLAECLAIAATGKPAASMALGNDGAELEKRLGATLMAGDPVLLLDNIETPVRSDLLCSMLTQSSVMIRVLGVSKRALLTTAALLILTGNGLVVRGDLTRRLLGLLLDPRCERPEERSFDRDARRYFTEHRAKIVGAAITIVLAYQHAREPAVDLKPVGSFEVWDRLVRRPLVWSGLADPMGRADDLRAADPDREAASAVLSAWHDEFKDKPMTAAQAAQAALDTYGNSNLPTRPDLYNAFALALPRMGDQASTARSLGYFLRRYNGRHIDKLVLRRDPDQKKTAAWIVQESQ